MVCESRRTFLETVGEHCPDFRFRDVALQKQGLLPLLFKGDSKVGLGTAGSIEAVLVLTLSTLK